jgi:hypothetical protein
VREMGEVNAVVFLQAELGHEDVRPHVGQEIACLGKRLGPMHSKAKGSHVFGVFSPHS